MMLEVNGKRKLGWRRQVEKCVKEVELKFEEAADQTKWREGVKVIMEG